MRTAGDSGRICYACRMLRALAALVLMAAPAQAWEAGSGEVCELSHDGETASVRVTYDPAIRQYAIAISLDRPWSPAPLFAMRFDGPRSLTITTDRHVLSDGGTTLTVTDRGFGNVLNGLEFNLTATALLGTRAVAVSLEGAAPAVQAFRACADAVSV